MLLRLYLVLFHFTLIKNYTVYPCIMCMVFLILLHFQLVGFYSQCTIFNMYALYDTNNNVSTYC